jgi:hypothetical protein
MDSVQSNDRNPNVKHDSELLKQRNTNINSRSLPIEWSQKMKRISMQVFVTVTAIAVMFMFSLSAHAQNAAEALYRSKCAGCHGAVGTGSATGTKSVGLLPVGRQYPLRISRSAQIRVSFRSLARKRIAFSKIRCWR